MVIILSVSENFELAILDDVGACGHLTLLHDELVVHAFYFLGVFGQLFNLIHREALEKWHFPKEIDLTIALFNFNFFEYADVVSSIKNCHTCAFSAKHSFLAARGCDVISFEGMLAETSFSFI